MTIRTTSSTVEFDAPFSIAGLNLPAGEYHLETDEDVIETASRTIFRRVATTLRVQTGSEIEHHPVDPTELAAALERDREFRMASKGTSPTTLLGSVDNSAGPPAPAPHGVAGIPPWRSIPMWIRTIAKERRDRKD